MGVREELRENISDGCFVLAAKKKRRWVKGRENPGEGEGPGRE